MKKPKKHRKNYKKKLKKKNLKLWKQRQNTFKNN